ncbi:MAG: STAS-like domain-containing protein [Bacteroidales bacterium]|nr:STAS-like domain-containing protein [Bacteroidales bacterium]
MKQINLNNYRTKVGRTRSRVFTGRDRGAEVRDHSGIDTLFSESEPLTIIIPDDIFSITPSFLEELFKNIVQQYGKETTIQNVKFEGKYRIKSAFDEALDRILEQKTGLEV